MDTIQEESSAGDINARKKAKEIEVELETQRFSANDRIVRKYFQVRGHTFFYLEFIQFFGLSAN